MARVRARRTRERIAQLEDQIFTVCAQDRPLSVRHIFYRMTDPTLCEPVEKTEHGYRQVQQRVMAMRRDGVLPYGWITDSTRMGWHVPTYENPEDFIRSHATSYRFDLWSGVKTLVEVWCESRSIAGMIQHECEQLAVSLYPCGGFASATLAYEAAQTYEPYDSVAIVYIGDYDPAGILIDRSLKTELERHTRTPVAFTRIAVNESQIESLGLPTKPRKRTDKRATHIRETVEAEAIPAPKMRELVRNAIESYLPAGNIKFAEMMERQGREYLRAFRMVDRV